MVRVMRDLSGDVAAARLAAALLFAMPGSPFLYYGEEIGMQGGAAERDEDKRTPMRWTGVPPGYGFTGAGHTWYGTSSEAAEVRVDAQRDDPDSLWRLYQRLIALRHNSAALQQGEATMPAVRDGARGVLALLRATAGERVLVVVNLHGQPSGPFSVELSGAPRLLVQEGLVAPPTPSGGVLQFEGLAGRGFAFVALD
jgi:glycosidase